MAETEAFWRSYRRHEGLQHDRYHPTYLRTESATSARLTAMMAAGVKRAVAAPLRYFDDDGEEQLPSPGDHAMLLDDRRRPQLIWRTASVSIAPLATVTDEFAWRDGDGSREAWLAEARTLLAKQGRRFGFEVHDGLETVFETLEVVWPLAAAQRARLLAPRFEQGLAMLGRLAEARAAASDLVALLARVETAVMTVCPELRLRFANPAAEALLRRGDGLRLAQGRIRTGRTKDDRALGAAVHRATACSLVAGGATSSDCLVPVARGDGHLRPYRLGVFAMPADASMSRLADSPVLLLVDDPHIGDGGPAPPNGELFAQAFGLTPAEARLAATLTAGSSLPEAADALGVTRNTARAHLRAVFDKTEVHSQAALVRLLQSARTMRLLSSW